MSETIPRECSSCRKVTVCKLFESMSRLAASWDAEFGGLIKFPMNPIALAKVCQEYESPLDVIKAQSEQVTI